MPKLWIPGVDKWDTGSTYFAPMSREGRSNRRVVWHKTEGNSVWGAAETMRARGGSYYHLVMDLDSGEMLQFTTPDRAARSLENGGLFHGVGCNRYGDLCIQVAVVGYSKDGMIPKGSRRKNLDKVLAWLDSWGIPREMPHGNLGVQSRNQNLWLTKSGHFSHAQAPGNSHVDPGDCSPEDLFGEEMPEFAQFSRKGFTVPPGRSVWLNWSQFSRSAKDVYSSGSSAIKIPGMYQGTVELQASGPGRLAFCEAIDGKVTDLDEQDFAAGAVLVSNMARLTRGRNLKIRVRNTGDKPLRVGGAQLRLAWWK